MRLCRKIGCAEEAVATCTFNYTDRQVWIGHLTFEREPGSYDLCEHHSEGFVAPLGWEITDLRVLQPVERLPA